MKKEKLTLQDLQVRSFQPARTELLRQKGGYGVSYVLPNGRPICHFTDLGFPCP